MAIYNALKLHLDNLMPKKRKIEYRYLLMVDKLLEAQVRLLPVYNRDQHASEYFNFLFNVNEILENFLCNRENIIKNVSINRLWMFRAFILLRLQVRIQKELPSFFESAKIFSKEYPWRTVLEAKKYYENFAEQELKSIDHIYGDFYPANIMDEAVEKILSDIDISIEDVRAQWLIELPLMTALSKSRNAALDTYAYGIDSSQISATEREREKVRSLGQEHIEEGAEIIQILKSQTVISEIATSIRTARDRDIPEIYKPLSKTETGKKAFGSPKRPPIQFPMISILDKENPDLDMIAYTGQKEGPLMFYDPNGGMIRRDRVRSMLLTYQCLWGRVCTNQKKPLYRNAESETRKTATSTIMDEWCEMAPRFFGRNISKETLKKNYSKDMNFYIFSASRWLDRADCFSGVYVPWYLFHIET